MIMRAVCLDNCGRVLSDRHFAIGYTVDSAFTVSVGKEYDIFAMALWQGTLLMLVADDHHLPNWFPAELFSYSHPRLPPDWLFTASLTEASGLEALWGYERLITDPSHYDALLEREPEALTYFYEEERLRMK